MRVFCVGLCLMVCWVCMVFGLVYYDFWIVVSSIIWCLWLCAWLSCCMCLWYCWLCCFLDVWIMIVCTCVIVLFASFYTFDWLFARLLVFWYWFCLFIVWVVWLLFAGWFYIVEWLRPVLFLYGMLVFCDCWFALVGFVCLFLLCGNWCW